MKLRFVLQRIAPPVFKGFSVLRRIAGHVQLGLPTPSMENTSRHSQQLNISSFLLRNTFPDLTNTIAELQICVFLFSFLHSRQIFIMRSSNIWICVVLSFCQFFKRILFFSSWIFTKRICQSLLSKQAKPKSSESDSTLTVTVLWWIFFYYCYKAMQYKTWPDFNPFMRTALQLHLKSQLFLNWIQFGIPNWIQFGKSFYIEATKFFPN